tara:strand:+ start:6592 stop:7803 length:1212 start_codon:yes stop_codon:yes gene_type:complete
MPNPDIPYNDENRAKSSIKSLNFELSNLSPSHLLTLFEIDLTNLIEEKGINLQNQAGLIGIGTTGASNINVNDGVLRFHNNIKTLNSFIVWRGKTYYPAPISSQGFEATTKGTLAQPTLTIASQSDTGVDQLALLKNQIREFGDIIGSKVTRIRTFAKYLDRRNFIGNISNIKTSVELPQGYEPDPYAQLPEDVYFIERKQVENKSTITYQLSSVFDTEGTKLPKRVVISDKCVWQYRGIGCWYQHADENEKNKDYTDDKFPPILKKAEISKLGDNGGYGLPEKALPTANDKDEKIATLLPSGSSINDLGLWTNNKKYKIGNAVYILKDKIKYYFVCKKEALGPEAVPPNTEYWIADECSKSLTGCRLRWGSSKGAANTNGCTIAKGQLPFGGFPAARKISQS